MKHATTRELYDYWNRLRGTARAPLRSEIEPSDIRRILSETFILEVGGRDDYFVRLAGTRVCAIFCRELKGSNLLDLWSGEDRHAMATLTAAVTEDGAGAVITISGHSAGGQEIGCEMVLLPLRHGGEIFNRVLGSFVAMERPFWLGSDPVEQLRITSLRLIWPEETPRYLRRKTDQPSYAAVPPSPRPAIRFPISGSRQHGHLYVVDGGKQ